MLTEKELHDIKGLQEACEEGTGFQLKLNFDMLKNRVENKNEDFFHYEDEKLVGFLGSYHFGNKVEICGMVHPDYRRRGIFSKLLEAGLSEVRKQSEIETILLNAPTGSESAKALLSNIPCTFSIAEYQMKWHEVELVVDPAVTLRPSESKEDFEAVIQLETLGFGLSEEEARKFNRGLEKTDTEQSYIIEADGKIAGKMRVSEENGEAWIYGFTIYPELRGKEIGRKALSNVVKTEHQKGYSIFLEVEAKNAHALGLYESCGFRTYHSQDYYLYQK
jgi:ribosomal protein S18 acetylase RimI-like enzyme